MAIVRCSSCFKHEREGQRLTNWATATSMSLSSPIAAIIANHTFVDGNKRTGYVGGVLFLELNGAILTAPESDAMRAALELTSGKIDENKFAVWLRKNNRRL